jgi:hypothetical protein
MTKIMKLYASIIIFILPLIVSASCTTEEVALPNNNDLPSGTENSESMKDTLLITIGSNQFTATLESNAAAEEFKKMLPLTINLKDLNSNEKFFDLPNNLPTNASNPRTINSGDLMLWGSNTLVLFYKTFNTSYSYTRLGKIENPSDLSQALGSGNVTVTFELFSK